MLSRLLSLFGRKPVLVKGVAALPEGQAKKITIGDPLAGRGIDVVLARVDGVVYAVDARCPHEGGRISDGPLLQGRYVTCPLHHYRFDPATGECENAPCGKARTYRAKAVGADLELRI